MKKIIIIIIMCLLVLCSCKKEDKNNNDNVKSINEIISIDVLDNYELVDQYYLKDFDEESTIENADKLLLVQDYASNEDDGYFTVEIYTYKGKYLYGEMEEIDVKDSINLLVRKETITIDNHEFYIGYSASDDIEDMNARAFVKHGDYVIKFSESNFDERITEKQYNEFISMLKTVKFH